MSVLLLLIVVSSYQIYNLIKKGYKKEAISYVALALLTAAFGIYVQFFKGEEQSLVTMLFNLFGITF